MVDIGRLSTALAGTLLALGMTACGSSGDGPTSNPTPAPTPTPVACTQTVVDSGSGSAAPHTIYFDDFSLPDTGRLDITVDWTVASNRIGVYVVPANTCTVEELNARSCNFLVRQEPSASAAKPLKISTPNVAAGNYRWMIGNGSDNPESLAFQVVLSKGSCAPLAAGAAGSSGLDAGPRIEFRHAQPLR